MSDSPKPRIADVVDDIPMEYRDRYETLLTQPSIPIPELRERVNRYMATVRQVGLMVKLLDMEQAEALATTALGLLDYVRPDHATEVKMIVQAAVAYFVYEEEDEEITGVLGFGDDAEVLNAVCRALSRTDLVLPVSRQD